ncbi:hypothetical protein WKU26_05625 [Phocaeicola sp. HCN-40430]|uniref:hypothetical protein n=1 Tax=Phocaeicola sp. HCN-40430 TaxID=3134664 RepID=UPI0030C25321
MMRYKLWYVVSTLLLVLAACSNEDTVITKSGGKLSRVSMDFPASYNVDNIKYFYFENGKLGSSGSVQPTGTDLKLPLEGTGTLYVIANEGNKTSSFVGSGMTEEAWQDATIDLDESQKPLNFIIGKVAVEDNVAEYSAVMKRGVARFDVTYAFPGTKVRSLTLKGMAGKSYLIEKVPFSVPSDVENVDLKVEGEAITGEDQTGVIYAYEQINPEATVEIEMADGKVHSAKLPEQILRNKVYTLQIGRDGSLHSITVDEWTKEEDEILAPDRESFITVNEKLSVLNDRATILPDARGVSVSYLSGTFDLALNCGEELEYVDGGNGVIEVTPVNPEASSLAERNVFRIAKKLLAPNAPQQEAKLQFRRKGFSEVYDEDCLTVVLEKNDDTLEGMLDFNNETYGYDFGRYIDGTLGTYTVGEGKTLSVDVPQSNPWLRVVRSEENRNQYEIQAGWKPNDPEADGREQSAKLIITDRNGNKQEYTIKRRNFGLPVVYVAGNWWCKYNLKGTANDFNDQILASADPVKEGSLLDYLKDCSLEELKAVMGDQYQGGNLEGLPLTLSGGKFEYSGFKSSVSVNINTQGKEMAPPGYEIPSQNDFRRLVNSNDAKLGYDPAVYNNNLNGDDSFRLNYNHGNRSVSIDDVAYGKVGFYDFCEVASASDNSKHVVLFGWGHQWEAGTGKISSDDFIFAVNNGTSTVWMMEGWFVDMRGNWFKTLVQNNVKTRTVRCKKSPVEYIYQ